MTAQREFREEIECCLYGPLIPPDKPTQFCFWYGNPCDFCPQSHRSFCLIQHCLDFGLQRKDVTGWFRLVDTQDGCHHCACCRLCMRISPWTPGQCDGWRSACKENCREEGMLVMCWRNGLGPDSEGFTWLLGAWSLSYRKWRGVLTKKGMR